MTIEEIISKAEKESNKNLINLTKTIAYATQQTYVKAMNDIYKQVGVGKMDHFTAYKKTVDELTKNGIALITKDGRREKIEVAVRRGLFGSLHQTANEIAKKVGEDIDYNCVVIGHSSTCRPSHNVIDDVVMSKKEFEKYEHLTEEYGCNHVVNYDWREEFEGIDDKVDYGNEHMTDEECGRNYKIQQEARYYERVVRAKKNVIERGDTSNKAKRELRNAQSKYRIYCNNNGLKVDYKRTWFSNKRSSSKVELSYKDITKEWLDKATPNSHKLKFDDYFMDDNGIRHPIKGKEKLHPIPKKGDEYDIAIFLKETLGGDIHLVPRISDISNEGISVKTPDFRWNGEKWDLKTPGIDGKFENTLERFLKKKGAKAQAKKYIIDYSNFSTKTDNEVLEVIEKTLKNRNWVEELIVIKDKKI